MTATNWLRGQTLVADELDTAFGRCIDRAGDTMSGLLTLYGDPSNAMDAATKQYVDNAVSGAAGVGYLPLTGGTLIGPLTLNGTGTSLSVRNGSVFGTSGANPISVAAVDGKMGVANGHSLTITFGGAGNSLSMGDGSDGLGVVATFNKVTGGNGAQDGSTGNTVVVSNILQSAFFRNGSPTYTLSGSLARIPLSFNANYTGSTTSMASSLLSLAINADTLDASAGSFVPLKVAHNMNAGARGNRITGLFALNLINGALTSTPALQVQPLSSQFQASVNVGGTDTGSGANGFAYGFYPQVMLNAGATNWALVNGWGEGDVAVKAGASVGSIYGGSTIFLASHAVAGASENSAWVVSAQNGAVPTWTLGYSYGNGSGTWPMASSATMQGTTLQTTVGGQSRSNKLAPQLATYGTDWANINFSQQFGAPFRSAGYAVDWLGQPTMASGLVISATGTGYSIDIPNTQKVTAVTINTRGNAANLLGSYYPGDIVYGTSAARGQYLITNTQVISATIVNGGSGGTNGPQTVTGTTGTGTKFQASVTVSGGTIVSVDAIPVGGNYTVNPDGVGRAVIGGATNVEPVTGGGLVGATLNVGMGVQAVSILVPDVFNVSPGTMTPIGGSGVGLVFNVTCTVENTLALNPSAAKVTLALLTNAANDAAASGAGVPVGGIYRNGSVMMQRVA